MPAHRYVEENGLVAVLTAKRLAGVAPEVNLRKHISCTPQPSVNKAAYSGFETQRSCQKSKTGVSDAPEKDLCPPIIFEKRSLALRFELLFRSHILYRCCKESSGG